MAADTHRLAANHYVCGPEVPFPAFAEAAARAGLSAVGLTRAAVAEMGVRPLARCLADNGLAVSSLNSAGYFTGGDAEAARRENEEIVEQAAALGAEVLCVITGGLGTPSLDPAEARARVRDGLEGLHRVARAAGVTLGLEPIHPADIVAKGCINSVAAADALTRDLDGMKLILDFYHSWWDPDLVSFAAEAPECVALIQVCNVRFSDSLPAGRDVLAGGGLDMRPLCRRILEGPYSGRFELELFDRDLAGRDPLALIGGFPAEFADMAGD
jgi:sugar phosphate isomerase/epimerase